MNADFFGEACLDWHDKYQGGEIKRIYISMADWHALGKPAEYCSIDLVAGIFQPKGEICVEGIVGHHTHWTNYIWDDDDEELARRVHGTWVSCEHEWVGSGMPGGMMWCKHCDIDMPEYLRYGAANDEG